MDDILTYYATVNHESDNMDSNGTTITIAKQPTDEKAREGSFWPHLAFLGSRWSRWSTMSEEQRITSEVVQIKKMISLSLRRRI
jgi:hypothetical protein